MLTTRNIVIGILLVITIFAIVMWNRKRLADAERAVDEGDENGGQDGEEPPVYQPPAIDASARCKDEMESAVQAWLDKKQVCIMLAAPAVCPHNKKIFNTNPCVQEILLERGWTKPKGMARPTAALALRQA